MVPLTLWQSVSMG